MIFKEISPTKSQIEWEVQVKPKNCGSYCAGQWMTNFFRPMHKEHFASNLRFQINKKYYGEVEVNYPGKKPTHSQSIKMV